MDESQQLKQKPVAVGVYVEFVSHPKPGVTRILQGIFFKSPPKRILEQGPCLSHLHVPGDITQGLAKMKSQVTHTELIAILTDNIYRALCARHQSLL